MLLLERGVATANAKVPTTHCLRDPRPSAHRFVCKQEQVLSVPSEECHFGEMPRTEWTTGSQTAFDVVNRIACVTVFLDLFWACGLDDLSHTYKRQEHIS